MSPPTAGWGLAVLAVFSVATVVVTVVSALRVYVRLRLIKRRPGWEDWTAAVSWLLFMYISGFAIAGCFYGMGEHFFSIPFHNLETLLKLTWIYDLGYVVTNMAIKLSITLMLLCYTVEASHKRLVWIVSIALQLISAVLFLMLLFQCTPVSFVWRQVTGDTNGRCMDPIVTIRVSYAYSGMLVIYDFTMALLPWFMVRKLQLDLQTRLMVSAVLSVGSVASIATIVRIPFVIALGRHTLDVFHAHAVVTIVSCVELCLSFAASSAATLKPLFRKASSQSSSRRPIESPRLATIKSTPVSQSTDLSTGESDLEFSTAFYTGTKFVTA